jgi:hypothetical protein
MPADVIETGIDSDHTQIGSLSRQPQGIAGVAGPEIDVKLVESRTPRLASRRGSEERKLFHLVAFPVRIEGPKAEKAARRSAR